MQELSDQELLNRIQQDDQTAFRKLFDRHYKTLLGTAINVLKEVDTGKDIVQEVFFQIWKKRSNLDVHTNLSAYLKRAVINRCLNVIKQRKPTVNDDWLLESPATLASALDDLAHQDLKAAMEKALESLPERCRIVFVMKRLEGLSQKEIAQQLNISTKTVENQITKALKVLKEALVQFR